MSRVPSFQLSGRIAKFVLPVVLCSLILTGCEDNSDEIFINDYVISYSGISTLPASLIKTVLGSYLNDYPEIADIISHANYSVRVYEIVYQTTYLDSSINASGLVCFPFTAGRFPMISFQNGTNTNKDNAPSANPQGEDYLALESLASNGYILLLPDYPGFGASAEINHPYYHKESTTTALADMIRAVRECCDKGYISVDYTDQTYIMGYSQGGWATMSLLEKIENSSPSDIEISAATCGGGAYNLLYVCSYFLDQLTFSDPLYLPYIAFSYQSTGSITDPLSMYFKEPYASRIPELFNGTYNFGEINSQLTHTIPDLVTDDVLDNFLTSPLYADFRSVLEINSVAAWELHTKLKICHGTADNLVPIAQASSLYSDFLDEGANSELVDFIEFTGLSHGQGIAPYIIFSMNWFNSLENK